MAPASSQSLDVGQEVSLLGKFAPTSCGYRAFPRYLPVSYSACHTVTWPDTAHPRIPVQKPPLKSPAGGLYFSLESRGDL